MCADGVVAHAQLRCFGKLGLGDDRARVASQPGNSMPAAFADAAASAIASDQELRTHELAVRQRDVDAAFRPA